MKGKFDFVSLCNASRNAVSICTRLYVYTPPCRYICLKSVQYTDISYVQFVDASLSTQLKSNTGIYTSVFVCIWGSCWVHIYVYIHISIAGIKNGEKIYVLDGLSFLNGKYFFVYLYSNWKMYWNLLYKYQLLGNVFNFIGRQRVRISGIKLKLVY